MKRIEILLLAILVICAIIGITKVEGMQQLSWYLEKNKDYSDANTIRSLTNVSGWSCYSNCMLDPKCAGVVADVNYTGANSTFSKGTCWLKSKLDVDAGVKKDNRYAYRLIKTYW